MTSRIARGALALALPLIALLASTPAAEAGVHDRNYVCNGKLDVDGQRLDLEGCMYFQANGRLAITMSGSMVGLSLQFESYADVDFLLFGFWSAQTQNGLPSTRMTGTHFLFGSIVFGRLEDTSGFEFLTTSGVVGECAEALGRSAETAGDAWAPVETVLDPVGLRFPGALVAAERRVLLPRI